MKSFQEFLTEASNCQRTSVQEFEKLIPKFLPFVFKELKMIKKEIPPMHFPHDSYDNGNGLYVKNIPGVTFTTNSDWGQTKHTWGQTSQKNRIVVDIKIAQRSWKNIIVSQAERADQPGQPLVVG